MDFDDSFFEDHEDGERWRERRETTGGNHRYAAKMCTREWFNAVNPDSCKEGAHVVLKYRADFCYHQGQLQKAAHIYLQVLEALPPSNTVVHREVIDSLARCHLGVGDAREALQFAKHLVTPPHDNDASSWQLMAHCHKNLHHIEDWVLCLQKCNLLQRYHTPYWLQLAEAYTSLHSLYTDRSGASTESADAIFSNTVATSRSDVDSIQGNVNAIISNGSVASACNAETLDYNSEVMFSNAEAILSNAITLFRPYFKWKADAQTLTDVEEDQMKFNALISTVSELLGRRVSVETFVQDLQRLPWEQHRQSLGVLLQVSSCCCLIWAKQLLLYSVRHSSSFVRRAQTDKLRHVEHLIGGYRDDLTHYLMGCFNHPTIFEDKSL